MCLRYGWILERLRTDMYVHVESSLDPIRERAPPSVGPVRNSLCYYFTIYPANESRSQEIFKKKKAQVTTLKLLRLNGH